MTTKPITTAVESIQANQDAEQAFIDYLIWMVAQDQDPHNSHDDPIATFRDELQQKVA
jgi:hypothetical protein